MLKRKAQIDKSSRNFPLDPPAKDVSLVTNPEGSLERQLFFPGQDMSSILSIIQNHRCRFESTSRARELQTIYFDAQPANERGIPLMDLILRCPFRLRWHSDQPSRVRALVESSKEHRIVRHPLLPFDLREGSWREILDQLCESDQNGDLTECLNSAAFPRALCQSRRVSFISADGRIRLTAEELLSVCVQDVEGRPNLKRTSLHSPLLLLEMRANSLDRPELDYAAQEFARVRRNLAKDQVQFKLREMFMTS